MYSQQELDDAVTAGVISPDAAAALRGHIERQRSTAIPDEEQFRLLTGFNDIFVTIAAAILLFAVGWIGQWVGQRTGLLISDHGDQGPSFLAPLAVAATAWGLALFFTARRRMALPSILLLLAFVGGVLAATAFLLGQIIGPDRFDNHTETLASIVAAVSAAVAAGGAWLHWRRFHVPITIAAGAAAVAGLFVALVVSIVHPTDAESAKNLILGFVLLLGVGMFLFAMWWDSSDRARLTRRSDVAFWLHLLAAPMIAHPVFTLLGVTNGTLGVGEAIIVVGPLHPARADGSCGGPPRPARLGACLCALCADRAVQAVRRGRAQHRADGAGDRFCPAAAVGLLAPGAAGGGHGPALRASGPLAEPRPDHGPTSRMSRRSSGARTPARSWPRFSN